MELRKLLAQNLRRLMDKNPNLDTQTKVSRAARASQSTIQRLLSTDQAATIDLLEKLAKAFKISPIELLMEQDGSALILRELKKLKEEDRARVHGFIELANSKGSVQNESGVLDFATSRRAPAQARQSLKKASSRETTTVGNIELGKNKPNDARKRQRSKT